MKNFSASRAWFVMRCAAVLTILDAACVFAAAAEDRVVTLADGKFEFRASESWKRVQPRVNFIEHEFSVPASEGDDLDGRFTVMGAGGSVKENVDRWLTQFTQPDGGSTKERAKVEKKTIAGLEVHVVDVSGTYDDKRGPFAPGVKRPNYRMLAAIILTKGNGNYFLKLYGPRQTIADQEQEFAAMVESLKAN